MVCVPTLDRGRAWFRERKDLPEATQLWIPSKQTFRCADRTAGAPGSRGQASGLRAGDASCALMSWFWLRWTRSVRGAGTQVTGNQDVLLEGGQGGRD